MKLFESCYAIGSQVKENIPPDELASLNEFLPGVAVSLVESLLFSKIMFKNQVFYSERCSNVKKRNCYTVSFLHHGVLSYGCIAYFLKLTTHHHGIQIYHLPLMSFITVQVIESCVTKGCSWQIVYISNHLGLSG